MEIRAVDVKQPSKNCKQNENPILNNKSHHIQETPSKNNSGKKSKYSVKEINNPSVRPQAISPG
jgi:hypothetical protein